MSDDEAMPTMEYDQAFFLDLARPTSNTKRARVLARERWNEWRRDPVNDGKWVTFEGVDFRTAQNRGISFVGLSFGDYADFTGSIFGEDAKFSGAIFGEGARFSHAAFGVRAWFDHSVFGDWADFSGATFGSIAHFRDTRFGTYAQFNGVSFGRHAEFGRATFDDQSSFSGWSVEEGMEAIRRRWSGPSETDRAEHEELYRRQRSLGGAGPANFGRVDFASAQFLGAVSFARRSFERPADFTGVRFDVPPDFDGATNLQRIDFTGAHAGFVPADRPWWKPDWTTDSTIAIRLRALRSQIEATKNHDFERDLYIEERKAERGIHLKRLWRDLRPARALAMARATLGTLPRLPKINVFAGNGEPMVRWPAAVPNRRSDFRPAFVDGRSPAALRLRRARRRHLGRFLGALGVLLGHCVWIAVMAVYWSFADYGRSWLRPAVWLVVVLALFHGVGSIEGIDARALSERRTEIVARTEAVDPGRGAKVAARYDEAVGLYAVANSIPFVGPLTIDGEVKRFLFCGEPVPPAKVGADTPPGSIPPPCVPLPPASLQIATISQNLLSILLVFFIGLALRNYFRVK